MSKLSVFFRRTIKPWRLRRRRYWSIDAAADALAFPTRCACCGRNAEFNRRETGARWDQGVLVPYCDHCVKHAVRAALLEQGAFAGSWIIGLSSAVLLSLSWLPLWAVLLTSAGLSLLPLATVKWFGLPRQLGCAVRGRALFLVSEHVFIGSADFAQDVAQHHGVALNETMRLQARFGGWGVLGPIFALIFSPFCYQVLNPSLRVLNFTDQRFTLIVDDHVVGSVEPTSGESPAAGEVFRVPSGWRRLRARASSGTLVADVQVTLQSGSRHLFAPGAKSGCLYVQRVAYGRSSLSHEADPRVIERVDFESAQRFWVVAPEIEPWFVPERSVQPGLTTGGVVSVLRMGRCR